MASTGTEGMDSSSFDQKLRNLADRIELTDLVSRLGLWLDEKSWSEASSILTEDVWVRTSGGSTQGIAAATDQARRKHSIPTHHVITNVLVDLAGDEATIRANLIVTFVADREDTSSYRTLGERYQFSARRTPAGWRLSEVEATPVWTTVPSDHVPHLPRQ